MNNTMVHFRVLNNINEFCDAFLFFFVLLLNKIYDFNQLLKNGVFIYTRYYPIYCPKVENHVSI